MLRAALVQISMELWGAIICLIFASFLLFLEKPASQRGYLLLGLLVEVFLILLSDTLAWVYRGRVGLIAYWAVRISNFLVFVLNYFIGYTILMYLEALLQKHGAALPPGIKGVLGAVCLLGIAVVTVSQFTGYLYTFDAQNRYARADGYLTISIIAGIMQILIAVSVLSCRRVLSQVQHAPLLLIIVLIFLAYLVQTFCYGVSLVNLAMAVVIMFFAYEKERVLSSAEKERQLLEKNLQLVQQGAELVRKDAQMATMNAQLAEKRTQIMLSQIQPHCGTVVTITLPESRE